MPEPNIFHAGCIDLNCVDCDKWMGHLMLDNPTDEEIKKAMAILNELQLMPLCDICSTTKGITTRSTKHMTNEDIPEISRGNSTICSRCQKLKFCTMNYGLWLCWECSGYAGMKEPK